MRPGAKGLIEVVVGFVVLMALLLGWVIWREVTTIQADDPISWYMNEAPRLQVFLLSLGAGAVAATAFWIPTALAFHFWWPAKAVWRRVYDAVISYGDPSDNPPDGDLMLAREFAFYHAQNLWRLSDPSYKAPKVKS